MIKVPENGQEGGQGQVQAKEVLTLFGSSLQRGQYMGLNKRE